MVVEVHWKRGDVLTVVEEVEGVDLRDGGVCKVKVKTIVRDPDKIRDFFAKSGRSR